MSLAKTIIYKSVKEVLNALQEHSSTLDELDEYGYTPLIQTAIIDDIAKAELVLKAGANPNFQDLTGRTALHWAADNSNYDLCKLLLENGANSNAYSYGGQPALVIPLLRKKNRIKKLLLQYGANIEFAQDFITAKLLGHRFELEGRVDIVDDKNTFLEVELEGFYLEFSLEILIRSLLDFHSNFGGKHLRQYFQHLDKIIAALNVASELTKYQHYLTDIKSFDKRINRLLDSEPLVLPIAFVGHAISLIKYSDMLIRCDRGEYGKKHGSVIFYDVQNSPNLNKQLYKELIYKRQSRESINEGLIQYLALQPKFTLPISLQRVGNCSWANVEAVVPALMFLLLLEERGVEYFKECEKEALNFYKEWVEWDKERSLYFCIDTFQNATPARQASKAALLASILFQACEYTNDLDPQKASKIIAILTIPEYSFILKSYFKVFQKDKDNINLKNMREFLDDHRVKIDEF